MLGIRKMAYPLLVIYLGISIRPLSGPVTAEGRAYNNTNTSYKYNITHFVLQVDMYFGLSIQHCFKY